MKQLRERLRILHPTHDYLLAILDGSIEGGNVAIISELTHAWLSRCCPAVAVELGLSVEQVGLQQALDAILTLH